MSPLPPPPAQRRPLFYAVLLASALLLAWCLSELTKHSYGPQTAADSDRHLLALSLVVPGLAGVAVGAAQLWPGRFLCGLAIVLLTLVMGECVLVVLGMCMILSLDAEDPDALLEVAAGFVVPLVVAVGCYFLIGYLYRQLRSAEKPPPEADPE